MSSEMNEIDKENCKPYVSSCYVCNVYKIYVNKLIKKLEMRKRHHLLKRKN